MTAEPVEVCILESVLRPASKGGGIAFYRLMALRTQLRVPDTAVLIVHDRASRRVTLAIGQVASA